ncbi:MAG: metallophosphoesterase, partial [Puniceicoccales bacterium]|nr:metallophosphoesterase [Puniceicoccales bacterium]
TQTGQTASKYALDGGFLTFADENNESGDIYISSMRFQDRVMTASEIQALGTVHAGGAATAGVQMTDNPADFKAGSFTIAILGDTQIYSRNDTNTDILKQSTQWLVDNKDARNIQHVIHVGDISDDSSLAQTTRTRTAMDTLNGEISYSVVRGNHDIYNSSTTFDRADTFGSGSAYGQQTSLVGYVGSGGEAQSTRNTYQTFEANGVKFLVLNLDISAKTEVVDWAKQVVSTHHDHRVIINTHAYMSDGGERFNGAIDPNTGKTYDALRAADLVGHNESAYNGSKYGGQDAEVLWNTLVSQYENIFLVISGHQFENYDQFKYKLDEGVNGNLVYQILVNQQDMSLGGSGWIRLLEFDPDDETIRVKTYSPYLDAWDTSADVYYNIGMSAIPEPSTYAWGLGLTLAGIGALCRRRRKA